MKLQPLLKWALIFVACLSLWTSGFYSGERRQRRKFDELDTGLIQGVAESQHVHQWEQWESGFWRSDGAGMQLRHCRTCGLGQIHELEKIK